MFRSSKVASLPSFLPSFDIPESLRKCLIEGGDLLTLHPKLGDVLTAENFAGKTELKENDCGTIGGSGHLTENLFPLTLTSTLTFTLKHNNLFGKTKWRHFSGKGPDTTVDY